MSERDPLDELFEVAVPPHAPPKLFPPPEPVIKLQPLDEDLFTELAQSTEFKRFIYKVLYGKVHRTEKQHGNLDQKVIEGLELLRDPNFSAVISELKSNPRFLKRKELSK